ncbi:MAG: hypothetical protein AUG51_25350 [Acidobacteria bacterium 13_1_20CM_3_53_8]|nr:MAG: hypothetical protein AUG51_25350 [Acidobacteria bacterium 13_1_20CM_3_53_8]
MVACREPCDPFSRGRIQSFGQRSQHHGDLAPGSFQTREGGMAPRTERGAAGRTSKRLDPRSRAMLAIPKKTAWMCASVMPEEKHFRLGQA